MIIIIYCVHIKKELNMMLESLNSNLIKCLIKNKSYQKFYSTKINNIFNYTMKYDEYNEIIDENYQYLQNNFCNKPNENINQEIENKIKTLKYILKK